MFAWVLEDLVADAFEWHKGDDVTVGRELHLVYATDMGFLLPCKVSVASAIARASRAHELVVDVLDCGIDDAAWRVWRSDLMRRLPKGQRIERHRIASERFSGLRSWHGSMGTYARMFLPEILADVEWCVYADGDTLFLADVFGLENLFDPNLLIQGHRDGARTSAERIRWFEDRQVKWDPDHYVCAGFLLMNLRKMREHNIQSLALEYLSHHPDSVCPDQDALNVTCRGYVGFLPEGWGRFNSDSFADGVPLKCVHYAMGKPWSFGCKWTHCLLDVEKLWFEDARRLLGLSLSVIGASRREYVKRWIRSFLHRGFLMVVCRFRAGIARWGWQRGYYAPRKRWFCPTVSFTFDDGLKSHATIAAPELEQRGWRGTFNVPTAFLDGGKQSAGDIRSVHMDEHPNEFMSWGDALQLLRAGHEVYPHTRHHCHLNWLIRDGKQGEFEDEVDGAVRDFERNLKVHPSFFCAPFHGECRELRRYLHSKGMMLLNCDRPNFGTNKPKEGLFDSVLPVVERRYHEGRRHIDLMIHGVTRDTGGWMPFENRSSFVQFLEEIADLEKLGQIKVVPYSAYHYRYSMIWRLLALCEWALNKSRRFWFKILFP